MTPWAGQLSIQYTAQAKVYDKTYTASGESKHDAMRSLTDTIAQANNLGPVTHFFCKDDSFQCFLTTKGGHIDFKYSLTQTQGSPPKPYIFGR
jgi:hypothetical protein